MTPMSEDANTLPNTRTDVAGITVKCPTCEHDAIIKPSASAAIRRFIGLKPAPASCPEPVEDTTGWGPSPCGCEDPSHGS